MLCLYSLGISRDCRSWDMDVLLLQFCAVAKEKMEHAIVLRMADRFNVQLCNPSKNLSLPICLEK